MRRTAGLAVVVATMAGAGVARADDASLYRGPGPRPGPDILYAGPAAAPQLTNAGVWRAEPILVSGASAYRAGEFLYQDFLYDDHGARAARDPGDPRTGDDTFSGANGTYTYPSDPVYAGNAADLVELRVKPLADATAFRLTLNSMNDAEKVAATIAIGSSAAPLPFPHGANATAPAAMFLTVHGASADLLDAVTQQPVAGGAPTASVDRERRQIEVRVPHAAWDPGRGTVRLAAGVGLWDAAAGRLPRAPGRGATRAGGGGGRDAFFNAAFRPRRCHRRRRANPAWWRDQRQGGALQSGDLSPFHADVDFGKLADGTAERTSGASCSSAAPAAASCAGRPPCAAPRAGCSRASCSARRCSAARGSAARPSTSRWRTPPAPASTCCAGSGSCGRCSARGASGAGARGACRSPHARCRAAGTGSA